MVHSLSCAAAAAIASAATGSVATHLNHMITTSNVFVGVSILSSLIVIPCNGFSLPRKYAYYLFSLYALYMVMSVLVVTSIVWPE